MSTKRTIVISLGIILASVILGLYVSPSMPEKVASHWNAAGEVDGYMTKFWGIYLMPIISFVMLLILVFIPKLDPRKENVDKFRGSFNAFIVGMLTFLFYIYLLTILFNLGYKFNMSQFMSPAFAALFYLIGMMIGKAKRNWFIGIRTPWTLESDLVWDKTHALGGKIFKLVAAVSLLGIVLPKFAVWLVIAPILIATIYLFVYSYFEFKKEKAG